MAIDYLLINVLKPISLLLQEKMHLCSFLGAAYLHCHQNPVAVT